METIVQVYEKMNSSLEDIVNTDPFVYETASENETHWQGDIGVQYLGTQKPELKIKETKIMNAQLAPGSNKGSRHILENISRCETFVLSVAHPLVGYIIKSDDGVEVSHPEHGDCIMNEPGWYAIRYQRAYADELNRQQD